MNKKSKEPFFAVRTINMILGFLLLVLILVVIYKGNETSFLEMLIFTLAAVVNFIAATVSFSEQKKLRGNIHAVICAVFFIIAVLIGISFLGIL